MRGRGATWAGIILAIIAAGGIAWWILYPRPSAEDRIRALITQLQRGVEDKAPNRVMALISDDYRDDFRLRRKDLSILVLGALRTRADLAVAIHQSRIQVRGREATATLEGEATVSEGPEAVGRYFGTVTLLLRREPGGWKVVSTRGWQKRVLQGFEAGE